MRSALVVLASLASACSGFSGSDDSHVATSMPWMLELLEHCETYRGATSDMDKGQVFRASQGILRGARVKAARGVVELSQKAGEAHPDEYLLQVRVGSDVKVASQTEKKPITRGTHLYEQARKLRKGSCVVFSATDIEAMSPFELGKVCTPHFYAVFSELRPCR